MANIRFVKSPNDNRVRSHSGLVMINDVISNSSATNDICISTPEINSIIRITTPKRQARSIDITDMFITNTNNNCHSNIKCLSTTSERMFNNLDHIDNMSRTNTSIDVSRDQTIDKYSSNCPDGGSKTSYHENVILNSASLSDKDPNSNVPVQDGKNDNRPQPIFEFRNGQRSIDDNVRVMSIDTDDLISDEITYIQNIQYEVNVNDGLWSKESQTEMIASNRPILKSYSTFDTASDGELSDVLDEEVDILPEISKPGSVVTFNICQRDQQQHEHKKLQRQDVQKQLPATLSSTRQQENQQELNLFDSGPTYTSSGSNRHMHRSISDAGMIENSKSPSFFRSINDSKFYGGDKDEPLYPDNMTINFDDIKSSSKLMEHRKLTQITKIAWDAAICNNRSSINENTLNLGSSKPRTMPGVGHFKISRSLSGDSTMADRLRIRRCALADPENMIMRQEVREKIERDVEKRRSSMVRKISQFFNVHLGLNKEEDLI